MGFYGPKSMFNLGTKCLRVKALGLGLQELHPTMRALASEACTYTGPSTAPRMEGPHWLRTLNFQRDCSVDHLPAFNWVAVKELKLSYHNGYI